MKVLVYIPCWINYHDSFHQIEKLRIQEKTLKEHGVDIQVEISVSINAVPQLSSDVIDNFRSHNVTLRHYPANLADVNINLGFLDAIQSSADFFWILSPDDSIAPQALKQIKQLLQLDSSLDFLVADEDGRGRRYINLIQSDFEFRLLSEASFGMVTGVVYRTESFRRYFHHGVQASFTGWGQLAVLIGAAKREGGIKGEIIPSDFLYFRGDPKQLSQKQKSKIFRSYAHSFFGFVVMMSLLSANPRRDMRRWIYKNWHLIGSYFSAYEDEQVGYVRLTDLRHLARISMNDAGIFARLLFDISKLMNLDALRKKLKID